MNQNYTITFPEGYVKPKLPGRDQWTAALRSGKYKQGARRLRVENNYCCLGVLCELQGRLKVIDGVWSDPYELMEGEEQVGAECSLCADNPVNKVLLSLGCFSDGVMVKIGTNNRALSLAELNDIGYTFNQIADIIEAIWDNE